MLSGTRVFSRRLALLAAAAPKTFAAPSDVRQRFIGAWDLVSFELRTPSGQTTYPLGADPVGRISYDASGHMSGHMMRRGLAKFAGDTLESATPDDIIAAWRGYIGYFGRYEIDEKGRAVVHHVEGAWYPNYVGTK